MRLLRPALLPLMLLGWGISKAARRSGLVCFFMDHVPERKHFGVEQSGYTCKRCPGTFDSYEDAAGLGRARRSG
jgi:hypothetical protein